MSPDTAMQLVVELRLAAEELEEAFYHRQRVGANRLRLAMAAKVKADEMFSEVFTYETMEIGGDRG